MKNKKKKIIYILVIIIIIILLIIFGYFALNSNPSDKNNNNKPSDPIMVRVLELIDNSHKYYLLKEGLVELGQDIFDDGEKRYISLNVEWIKNLGDIQDIVLNTFTKELKVDLYTKLNDKQKFIEFDEKVYVALSEESCEINYNIDKDNITYKIREDGSMVIDLGDAKAYAYKEDDVWKLRSVPYDCQNNK